ncbi:hypothetical protein BDN72DRAFT_755045 [Pluteus cervinus]|uniref:Uncharacterized protein n=1 Tax=Pluteus cervinus TaxID=181527 RepID=A0ACD3BIS6_9AGAR|nr:hypothetical protein BDN72DRAFT_755045 [Pluteus cervinus]
MLDSSARQPLSTSFSFQEAPDSPSSPSARPLKRRLTSDLTFFTPAASSFKPKPYVPNGLSSESRVKSMQRTHTRSLDSLSVPPPSMDPHATDPNVVFVRAPFTNFPNAHLYPEGLSYPLMAENPEWFLDAADFLSQNNTSPGAVPYPSHLEPPRGWCPAKKKDLKDRGTDGWPEGEEPRLRCTFCRRTYAGVNAKSMWRRHVFEKHKIAMSNRRDTNDRPRGRGSNKENRQSSKSRDEAHDHVLNLDVTPQTDPRTVAHKSRFRTLLPAEEAKRRQDRKASKAFGSSSRNANSDDDDAHMPSLAGSNAPPSPPLTPPVFSSSDSNNGQSDSATKSTQSSPVPRAPLVPPSPYDPTLTPSFRHSPPRLPSDQPWRFPSPSHPLHSRSRELSLSMLVHNLNTPRTKVAGESPKAIHASPLTSNLGLMNGKTSVFDTPESLTKFARPSPRLLFSKNRVRTDRGFRIEESPLNQTSRLGVNKHKRGLTALTDDWLTETSSSSTLAINNDELLAGNDPFATVYNAWTPVKKGRSKAQDRSTLVLSPVGAESPVLRSGGLPPAGLGIGLLEPFTLPSTEKAIERDSDFDMTYSPEAREKVSVGEDKDATAAGASDEPEGTPPLKKRKTEVAL